MSTARPGGRGLLLVAAGAAVGGTGRHVVDVWISSGTTVDALGADADGVAATLVVNVVGALLLGLLVTWAGHHRRILLLLGTGLLGSFTTFGTLALLLVRMVDEGRVVAATAYVATSLVLGLLAAWAGTVVGRRLPRAGVVEPDPEDPR